MKKRASTFFAFLCLFLVLTGLGTSTVESAVSADIYGKVLRLHVIANSDSDFDQKLKLKVRDGILGVTQELFSDCKNVDLALETANKNIKVIEDSAKKILLENGFFGNVKVVLGKEMYPPKKYGSFTFPKGEYLSVRVLIGEAAGKNWWCVLFPPLCNAGIDEGAKVLEAYGLNKKEIEALQRDDDKYTIELFGCKIKFKILEYF